MLVGTQMVAKGHDFPDVTLGVVLDADATLRFPDFRAEERTFALVAQLAGRSGRGERGGRVIVQALDPTAEALRFAARHDADGFLEAELGRRELLGYPPHGHLIRVVCSSTDEGPELEAAKAIRERVSAAGVPALGPAPLFRRQARHRAQLVIRSQDRTGAIAAVREAVETVAAMREHAGRELRGRRGPAVSNAHSRPALDSAGMADEHEVVAEEHSELGGASRGGCAEARSRGRGAPRRGDVVHPQARRSGSEVEAPRRSTASTTRSASRWRGWPGSWATPTAWAWPRRSSASRSGCSSTASAPTRRVVALANPELEWTSDDEEILDEGCLSIPGITVDVERPVYVRVRALDEEGETRLVEASGLEARVIQHEMDHLNGVLILDRTTRDERKRALRELREAERADEEAA